MAPQDEPDRRRRLRASLEGEVLGKIHTETAAPVLNLSESGALLEVSCALGPGVVYTLRLPLSPERTLSLRSRVVRSYVHAYESGAKDETAVRYRAAVEFVFASDEERRLMQRHLGKAPTVSEGEPASEEEKRE